MKSIGKGDLGVDLRNDSLCVIEERKAQQVELFENLRFQQTIEQRILRKRDNEQHSTFSGPKVLSIEVLSIPILQCCDEHELIPDLKDNFGSMTLIIWLQSSLIEA